MNLIKNNQMKKIVLLIVGYLMCLCDSVQAQVNDLSDEDLKMFAEETKHIVDRFQMYLSYIGGEKASDSNRLKYRGQSLKLFIGKGVPYKDYYGNIQPAPVMQTTSKYRKEPKLTPIGDYLNNLINLVKKGTYSKVEITAADTVKVGDFHKLNDGFYTTTATIKQRFVGYRENGVAYVDITVKRITIYLKEILTTVGNRYAIVLGDIEAVETH